MDIKRNVIIVTDGDHAARQAVEIATTNIGGRTISMSAGNPTILSGEQIVDLIRTAHHDPVVVMADDRGFKGEGKGEHAMEVIANSPYVNLLGVLAVASNGKDYNGVPVNCSIDKDGNVTQHAVDKFGNDLNDTDKISGDTVSILKRLKIPVIVGIGDPGKMEGNDDITKKAPITTLALREVMKQSGIANM